MQRSISAVNFGVATGSKTNQMKTQNPTFETTVREMSHELRTPLTSIMGFAELLLEDESLTGQTREYLTVISEESRRLSEMLNHYLSMLLVDSASPESNSPEGSSNS